MPNSRTHIGNAKNERTSGAQWKRKVKMAASLPHPETLKMTMIGDDDACVPELNASASERTFDGAPRSIAECETSLRPGNPLGFEIIGIKSTNKVKHKSETSCSGQADEFGSIVLDTAGDSFGQAERDSSDYFHDADNTLASSAQRCLWWIQQRGVVPGGRALVLVFRTGGTAPAIVGPSRSEDTRIKDETGRGSDASKCLSILIPGNAFEVFVLRETRATL
ncbi:hypothetical protein BV22DRAFT_1045713 [Leucogyrophana mollusca]|uniref:Uncharacterized protein n=1 Tax=Leucogyrophana mollusca TaxID=85980 RepID=A0ACB8BNA5_9AGAM|nr:hypothetical protein BV22DRAFT_1045713 [Leucogyrophana mollusca]